MQNRRKWLQVGRPLPPKLSGAFAVLSFALPVLLWCLVSYVPLIWHPQILITLPGSVDYLQPGMRMDKAAFDVAAEEARAQQKALPEGIPSNPIYLPAPHEV